MVCGAVYLCVYIVGVYTHSQIPAILSFSLYSLFRNIHFKLVGLCEVFFLFIKKKKLWQTLNIFFCIVL